MLKVIEKLKEISLDELCTTYNLCTNIIDIDDDTQLILLKVNSKRPELIDYSIPLVRECRGLIVEYVKSTAEYRIISLPFYKFFNHNERKDEVFDWDNFIVQEKYDGTMMILYYYDKLDCWFTSTNSTYNADVDVSCIGDSEFDDDIKIIQDLTFSELFWITVTEITGLSKLEFTSTLDKNHNYIFELCTPHNTIVIPYLKNELRLLTMRNMVTLLEVKYNNLDVLCPLIPKSIQYDYNNVDDVISSLVDKKYHETEGYVVCDKDFNRLKIKSLEYVAVHRKIGNSKLRYLLLILKNEQEEFLTYFPNLKPKVDLVSSKYNSYCKYVDDVFTTHLDNRVFSSNKEIYDECFRITSEYGLTELGILKYYLCKLRNGNYLYSDCDTYIREFLIKTQISRRCADVIIDVNISMVI